MAERLKVGVIGCGVIAQVMHLPHLLELDELLRAARGVRHLRADRDGVRARATATRRCSRAGRRCSRRAARRGARADLGQPRAGRDRRRARRHPRARREADVPEPRRGAADARRRRRRRRPADGRDDEALRPGVRAAARGAARGRRAAARPGHDARVTVAAVSRELRARAAGRPRRPSCSTRSRPRTSGVSVPRCPDADENTRYCYRWMLLDNLVHELNALRGALGEPELVKYAELSPKVVNLSLVFDGVDCHLSWVDLPGIARYRQEFAFYGLDARATLTLPSPYLRGEPSELAIEGGQPDASHSWRTVETVSYVEAFKRELLEFHAAITEGRPPRTDGADGLHDVALCNAIARAHMTGEAVAEPSATNRHGGAGMITVANAPCSYGAFEITVGIDPLVPPAAGAARRRGECRLRRDRPRAARLPRHGGGARRTAADAPPHARRRVLRGAVQRSVAAAAGTRAARRAARHLRCRVVGIGRRRRHAEAATDARRRRLGEPLRVPRPGGRRPEPRLGRCRLAPVRRSARADRRSLP